MTFALPRALLSIMKNHLADGSCVILILRLWRANNIPLFVPSPLNDVNEHPPPALLQWPSPVTTVPPLACPSQTADAFGWESDTTPVPVDAHDTTPTPQFARPSSPESVMEISREDFPMLAAPAPATAVKPRTRAKKADKGKGKAMKTAPVATHASNSDDPFLVADIASATAASLGQATGGASSSCRPAASAGSPSKRQHSNTAGDAAPAPFVTTTAIAATPMTTAAPAKAPSPPTAAVHVIAPAVAPVAQNTVHGIATHHPVAAATVITPVIAPPPPVTVATPATVPAVTVQVATTAVAALPLAPVAAAPVAAAPVAVAPAAAAPTTVVHAVAPPLPAAAALAAVAPILPPLWLTADGLPPRGSYTPTPAAGYPAIMYSPEILLRGIPPDLICMYEEVPFPKFFLVVSRGNRAVMKTHGLIREAIRNFINIDPTAFTLGTLPTVANGTSLSLWLAADIPDHLADAIVDNRILSSTAITLYTLPYHMPVIGFVGIFAGFTLPDSNTGANAARDLIRAAIKANGEISQFVQTHHGAFGPQVSAEEAWDIFLNSVSVQGIVLIVNDTNTVAWRLHVTPPTNDREPWSQLCRLFGRLHIMTAHYGNAKLQWDFCCRICPSIDHPTPLCPLPNLPGWLGPTPATIAALEEASRAAASKAQDQTRLNTFTGPSGSSSRSANGHNQGPSDAKGRRDGKGKKGGNFKGKGKRREHDNFY
ncbi:hypothetical protein C8R44DRAFT_894971 [Mycena epipterygia]|nr:hypothetical protein C8R44DRAFT_894971 [Mycena epipterygia]